MIKTHAIILNFIIMDDINYTNSKSKEFLFKKVFLSENLAITLLILGIFLIIIFLFVFIYSANYWSLNTKADTGLISEFGDIIGGVIGSLWALAGVILFYLALESQKESYQLSRESLNKQVEALNAQIEESKEQGKIFTRSAIAQEKTQKLINQQLKLSKTLSELDLLKSLAQIHSELARIEVPGDIQNRYKEESAKYIQKLIKKINLLKDE